MKLRNDQKRWSEQGKEKEKAIRGKDQGNYSKKYTCELKDKDLKGERKKENYNY